MQKKKEKKVKREIQRKNVLISFRKVEEEYVRCCLIAGAQRWHPQEGVIKKSPLALARQRKSRKMMPTTLQHPGEYSGRTLSLRTML